MVAAEDPTPIPLPFTHTRTQNESGQKYSLMGEGEEIRMLGGGGQIEIKRRERNILKNCLK